MNCKRVRHIELDGMGIPCIGIAADNVARKPLIKLSNIHHTKDVESALIDALYIILNVI